MSLRDDLLPVVDEARKITQDLGQRTTSLTVRTRTWSGTRPGDGIPTDVDLVIPARYSIKELSPSAVNQLVSNSGGSYGPGRYVKLWVTPAFNGGGYTQEQLSPDNSADNVEIIYVLAGSGINGEFNLCTMNVGRAYRYELLLVQRNATPNP
jgi:hypothetical protein